MKATLRSRAGWIIAVFFLMVPLTGCFSLMSYQTADTIPKGGVDLGFGWSVTKLNKIEYTGEDGQTEHADTSDLGTIPNLLPDILLRFGLSDNIDMGMRLFFLGIHGDAKFRLVNGSTFSLAIAPGVLYSRPLIIFSQYGLDVPLLFTVKLGEYTKIYGGVKGELSGWTLELNTENSKKANISTFAVGGHLGISFGGKRWYIRPELGYTAHVLGLTENCKEKVNLSYLTFGLGFGFVFGVGDDQQDKKIEDLEQRMNQMEQNKASQPKPEAAPEAKPEAKPEVKPEAKPAEDPDAVRKRAEEAAEDLKKEEAKKEQP